MTTPNLFSLATSELSQDAFITWLLQWASPQHRETNSQLHAAGVSLIQSLLAKYDSAWSRIQINKLIAGCQRDHIDIWAEINDSIFLLIEDKVDSNEHSNQLVRYMERAVKYTNHEGETFETVIPIYLKTGNESKQTFEKNDRLSFSRGELLAVLKQYSVDNAIYSDFLAHWQSVEDATNAYQTLSPDQWDTFQIQGFYSKLEEDLNFPDCGWKYVANPNGGIWAMYWGWSQPSDAVSKSLLYFQIEDAWRFTIRGENQNAETMWHILSRLQNYAKANNLPISIEKAGRFRGGSTAAIASIVQPGTDSFLFKNPDGTLDIETTVQFVCNVTSMLSNL